MKPSHWPIHKPDHVVLLQRPEVVADMGQRDVDWDRIVFGAGAAKPAGCVSVAATDPLYILYTSGTTGQPKGVVRDNGGHMVAMHWSMENIYDMSQAKCSGPRRTWAGSLAIATSSMHRCCLVPPP